MRKRLLTCIHTCMDAHTNATLHTLCMLSYIHTHTHAYARTTAVRDLNAHEQAWMTASIS